MTTRNLKAQCPRCGCTWRMAGKWFDLAKNLGGLRCPVCCSEAVAGDILTDEVREVIHDVVSLYASRAAAGINAVEAERRQCLVEGRRRFAR